MVSDASVATRETIAGAEDKGECATIIILANPVRDEHVPSATVSLEQGARVTCETVLLHREVEMTQGSAQSTHIVGESARHLDTDQACPLHEYVFDVTSEKSCNNLATVTGLSQKNEVSSRFGQVILLSIILLGTLLNLRLGIEFRAKLSHMSHPPETSASSYQDSVNKKLSDTDTLHLQVLISFLKFPSCDTEGEKVGFDVG